jgi:hypothetical protein
LLVLFLVFGVCAAPPPGVIIDHSPASSGVYIGSPSITILPNGQYLTSHDFFGPKSAEFESPTTVVFASADRGQNWQKVASLRSLFWAGLFVHRDAAYIMGTDKHHGHIVIRRSTDNGRTWTEPVDSTPANSLPAPVITPRPRPSSSMPDGFGALSRMLRAARIGACAIWR